MKKKPLVFALGVLALVAAFAGGNASVPRLTGERAELAQRITRLQGQAETAARGIGNARKEAAAARREAAEAEARASQADARIAQADALTLAARREKQEAIDRGESERSAYESVIAKRDARVKELEAKIPSSATQVRLAAGGLLGKSFRPNARCPHCGTLLMIGEVKELDSGTTLSGMFAGKPVMCPHCNESFEPVWAQETFTIEREEAAGRRRR